MTEYIEHITGEAERWDSLAWRYYGDATRYEPIISANPGIAILPWLPGGVKLYIPVLEKPAGVSSPAAPPWLR